LAARRTVFAFLQKLQGTSLGGCSMQRKILRLSLFVLFTLVVSTFSNPAMAQSASITRSNGGSVKIELGYGIVLNKESSLTREWITVHHALPVAFDGTVGVGARYKADKVRGEYQYNTKFEINVKEPIVALEIRFLVFDIWGRHSRTLSFTRVADMDSGKRSVDAAWNLFAENEASEFYASIAYIAKVRTKAGRIVASDTAPVLEEARKFSSKFSVEDLEPQKPPAQRGV
jgi:hypothetical protein